MEEKIRRLVGEKLEAHLGGEHEEKKNLREAVLTLAVLIKPEKFEPEQVTAAEQAFDQFLQLNAEIEAKKELLKDQITQEILAEQEKIAEENKSIVKEKAFKRWKVEGSSVSVKQYLLDGGFSDAQIEEIFTEFALRIPQPEEEPEEEIVDSPAEGQIPEEDLPQGDQ